MTTRFTLARKLSSPDCRIGKREENKAGTGRNYAVVGGWGAWWFVDVCCCCPVQAGASEHARELGGKGSDCHKAAVIGDTVGDPLKDTSGTCCPSFPSFRTALGWGQDTAYLERPCSEWEAYMTRVLYKAMGVLPDQALVLMCSYASCCG